MDAIVLAENKKKVMLALAEYADMLSNLTPEQVPQAFELTKQMSDLTDEVHKRLREQMLQRVQAEGQTITEKGSMALTVGGYKVTAIPTKTGIDPKKLESLLRKRGADVEAVMDATVSYKLNPGKVAVAEAAGKLTRDDIANCTYDKAFRVQVERDTE